MPLLIPIISSYGVLPVSQKVDVFFELLRGIYGQSLFESQWPDETHLQAAKVLWSEHIERHTEQELKDALDHAQKMIVKQEKGWTWPNVGLILSGAKRIGIPSHRMLLTGRERTPEELKAMREDAVLRVRALKAFVDGTGSAPKEKEAYDLW